MLAAEFLLGTEGLLKGVLKGVLLMEEVGRVDKVLVGKISLTDDALIVEVLMTDTELAATKLLVAEALAFAIAGVVPSCDCNSEVVELSKLFSNSHSSSPT